MFDGVEVYQYRRDKDGGGVNDDSRLATGKIGGGRKSIINWLNIKDLAGMALMLSAGFLLGRSVLLGELLPFGPAFVAAAFAAYRGAALPALLGTGVGLFTATGGWDLAVRCITLAVAGMTALSLPARAPVHYPLGGAVFALMVLAGTGYAAVFNPSNYEYIRVLFESVFGALLAVAFFRGISSLSLVSGRKRVPADGLFCLALLGTSIVAAAGQLQWGYVSPGGVLAGLAVMVAGHVGGGGLGASAGAVMGILPGLVYVVSPSAAGAAAFAGLLAGLCRVYGRAGVVAGFLLGHVLLIVYLGNGGDITEVLSESASAAALFLLIPGFLLQSLREYLPVVRPWNLPGEGPGDTRGDGVIKKLEQWGKIFEEIARSYHRAESSAGAKDKKERPGAVEQLKELVCSGCPVAKLCWGKEQSHTRRLMHELMAEAGQGKVPGEVIDNNPELAGRCSRRGELAVGAGCLAKMQRMSRYWENCLEESRELVYGHMRGMRGVIRCLAREIEAERETWRRRAGFYKQELKQAGLQVSGLAVYPGEDGKCEIEVTMPACGGLKKCLYDMARHLSRLSDMDLAPAFLDCTRYDGEDFCTIRFYPGIKYGVRLGLVGIPAPPNTVSGDSHCLVQLGGGRLAVILSDGMGTGTVAAAESRATLRLLQQLLKAGFEGEPAIRMVNSTLMRNSQEDKFATVDMIIVNLYTGHTEMIKIGAAPSIWVSKGDVEIILSKSLPVGIVEEIHTCSESRRAKSGDMVVMVTDGVMDAHRGEEKSEEWVAGVLKEIIHLPPREVAELLAKLAQSRQSRRAPDDMTIAVIQIDKNRYQY